MVILLFLAVLVLVIAVLLVMSAVTVGLAASWFLHIPFGTGWEAAWDRPGLLVAFALIVGALLGGSRASSS